MTAPQAQQVAERIRNRHGLPAWTERDGRRWLVRVLIGHGGDAFVLRLYSEEEAQQRAREFERAQQQSWRAAA